MRIIIKYLKLLQYVSDHKGSIIRKLYAVLSYNYNGRDRTITVILAKHCI